MTEGAFSISLLLITFHLKKRAVKFSKDIRGGRRNVCRGRCVRVRVSIQLSFIEQASHAAALVGNLKASRSSSHRGNAGPRSEPELQ